MNLLEVLEKAAGELPGLPEITPRPTTGLASARFGMWPHFAPDEILAVCQVLASGRVNRWTGEQNVLFEKEYASSCGMPHAIALANGTLALELALAAFDIGPGDEVIVPCRTFIASASSAAVRGARPVIADVDPVSQNLSAATIHPLINERTKAVICVHHGGWPCDMDPIIELAHKHNFHVIEDCAQAHGARYKGRPVGSIGEINAFSFCQDKILTTGGEGGLVLTRDEALYKKMWAYKDHGKDYDTVYHQQHPVGFRWLHGSFGTNWRMLELQAVLGRVILQKLTGWVERRRLFAEMLDSAFADTHGLALLQPGPDFHHAYYKYYVRIRPECLLAGWTPTRVREEVTKRGVPCLYGTCWNISAEEAFRAQGWEVPDDKLPGAVSLRDRLLQLLVHPTLEEDDIRLAARTVNDVLAEATGASVRS